MMNLEYKQIVKYNEYKIIPRSKKKYFKNKTSGHEWSESISLPGYNIFGIGVFSNQKFSTVKKCKEYIDFLIKFNLNVRMKNERNKRDIKKNMLSKDVLLEIFLEQY